jgi:hypothetical protein
VTTIQYICPTGSQSYFKGYIYIFENLLAGPLKLGRAKLEGPLATAYRIIWPCLYIVTC